MLVGIIDYVGFIQGTEFEITRKHVVSEAASVSAFR
jgi:hypothetical protein